MTTRDETRRRFAHREPAAPLVERGIAAIGRDGFRGLDSLLHWMIGILRGPVEHWRGTRVRNVNTMQDTFHLWPSGRGTELEIKIGLDLNSGRWNAVLTRPVPMQQLAIDYGIGLIDLEPVLVDWRARVLTEGHAR